MNIFVVSRSRFDKSDTLESLGKESSRVGLVVPSSQKNDYKELADRYSCTIIPCKYSGISKTRKFCGDISDSEKFVMFDDDLTFYRRISESDNRLRYLKDLKATPAQLLKDIESCLDKYAHCSISAREGNNRLPYSGVECSRPLRVLAYQTKEFTVLEHGRVQVMEDFDVTLQLLRKGLSNLVIAKWSQGQKQTQAPGGCSDYRTLEVHEENVKKFAGLHSEFVKLRQKNNKTGGSFGSRLEATIYWKRAFLSVNEKIPRNRS